MSECSTRYFRRAFTLIELLVVVAIIALLISLLLPGLAKAKESAKLTKCAANLHAISIAINSYANTNKDIFPECYSFYSPAICYDGPTPTPNSTATILHFADCLWINGDVVSGHPWGYDGPVRRYGTNIFQCPSAAPRLQYGQDAPEANGYGLGYYTQSHFQNLFANGIVNGVKIKDINGALPNSGWKGLSSDITLLKFSNLKPNKILMFDGSDSGCIGPPKGNVPDWIWYYWVYPRHFAKDTFRGVEGSPESRRNRYIGTANYLFCDSHVEASDKFHLQSIYQYSNFDASPFYQVP